MISSPPRPVEASGLRVQEQLERGSGRGKILLLDAQSGIAGDMTVAALLDLGVPLSVVEQAIEAVGLEGVRVRGESVRMGPIAATRFLVEAPPEQPQRSYAEIEAALARSALEAPVRTLTSRIFRRLAEAEARVHGVPVDSVHFHEVGAVDSIVDVVGTAACLVHLEAEVLSSPLPLGHGRVHTQHGWLPLPAPAVVECLKQVPTYHAGLEGELVTPTGAAIVSSVVTRFTHWPEMVIERIGWGAGTRVLPDRPNALRVVLGARPEARASEGDGLVVLETNLDDLTGELAGHTIEALLAAGALDAWVTACTMKKGRPGMVLSVLARQAQAGLLASVILRETSSLGVRSYPVSRTERPREVVLVQTRYGPVPVKISSGPYGPPQLKPEFMACAAIAAERGLPVREVMAEALQAARSGLGVW